MSPERLILLHKKGARCILMIELLARTTSVPSDVEGMDGDFQT